MDSCSPDSQQKNIQKQKPNSRLQWHFTSHQVFFSCKTNACVRGFSKETGIAPHHHEVSHAIRAAHLPTLELWSTSAWPPILQMQVEEPSSLETEPFTVNCLTLKKNGVIEPKSWKFTKHFGTGYHVLTVFWCWTSIFLFSIPMCLA